MSIGFSDTVNNTGIVQQARFMARVDASQWPIAKIVNSANHWSDFVTGYAIGADGRFQWDNTNHTKLPEGTTALVEDTSDYSFLTDEQGNAIITLIGLSLVDGNGVETPLELVDRNDVNFDLETFGNNSGTPSMYDKIADNIVRLDTKPTATDVSTYSLKFYFQRVSTYFDASDTTQTTGFSPLLDRGWVVACAYDIALTLGLPTLQALAAERAREEQRVVEYFANNRDRDDRNYMQPEPQNYE